MSGFLIGVCGVIYGGVAISAALKSDWPTVIVFAGYSFSNVGLYMMAR